MLHFTDAAGVYIDNYLNFIFFVIVVCQTGV